jgi:hypothetical protein
MSTPTKKRRTGTTAVASGLDELAQAVPEESVTSATQKPTVAEKVGEKRKTSEPSTSGENTATTSTLGSPSLIPQDIEMYIVTITSVGVDTKGKIVVDTVPVCFTGKRDVAESGVEKMRRTFGLLIELGQVCIDLTAYESETDDHTMAHAAWTRRYNQSNASTNRLQSSGTGFLRSGMGSFPLTSPQFEMASRIATTLPPQTRTSSTLGEPRPNLRSTPSGPKGLGVPPPIGSRPVGSGSLPKNT